MGKTSSEAKRRYNQKVYSKIVVEINKELVEAFKLKCKERGDSQASIIKAAVEKYLAE